jgi:hypothetical protein
MTRVSAIVGTLMFAVSSRRREYSSLDLQAVQHGLFWTGQEARS